MLHCGLGEEAGRRPLCPPPSVRQPGVRDKTSKQASRRTIMAVLSWVFYPSSATFDLYLKPAFTSGKEGRHKVSLESMQRALPVRFVFLPRHTLAWPCDILTWGKLHSWKSPWQVGSERQFSSKLDCTCRKNKNTSILEQVQHRCTFIKTEFRTIDLSERFSWLLW